MEKLIIQGGHRLSGSIAASGAKNAALPILIATLLAPGEHRLANVPDLADISSTLSLLGRLGCPSLVAPTLRVDTTRIAFCEAPYDIVSRMRASVLALGPLLARHGEAIVSMPGGCAIGTRPIDQHLKGLEALGCNFELSKGNIHGTTDGLRGAEIDLDMPTVGGTENILMAAVLAEGDSIIRNAAREPEIVDLANFLITLGAKIQGAGTSEICVTGVPRLSPASRPYRIMPDRIEVGTYLCAAAITRGDVTVTDCNPNEVRSLLGKLTSAGAKIETTDSSIRLVQDGPVQPFELTTEPHPGFPTDMQSQMCAVACFAEGVSTITEKIFENRFMHAAEMARMGAYIDINGRTALVRGTGALSSAVVMSSDLRASAALAIAAMGADAGLDEDDRGLSELRHLHHLDRGYENLVDKFRSLGAHVGRVADDEHDPYVLLAKTQHS